MGKQPPKLEQILELRHGLEIEAAAIGAVVLHPRHEKRYSAPLPPMTRSTRSAALRSRRGVSDRPRFFTPRGLRGNSEQLFTSAFSTDLVPACARTDAGRGGCKR